MIFIVIPVFNRKDFTRNCLISLQKQSHKDFYVIVTDDGSTDGTSDMIKTEFPEVVLLKGDGNLWWTGATNLGVNYALGQSKSDHDYVLTLNNDLEVKEDYIQSLLKCAEKYPDTLIGSLAVNIHKPDLIEDGGVLINFWSAKYRYINKSSILSEVKKGEVMKVSALPGRGTLIPIEVFKKIGLFNFEKLPQYGADYEFSIRASGKGYTLIVSYNSIVYSHADHTGLKMEKKKSFVKYIFDLRSPGNVIRRLHFAFCLPFNPLKKLSFAVFDFLRSVTHYFRKTAL